MALGFPDSLYDEMFGDGPKVVAPPDPLRQSTELSIELELVTEFAHGSIDEWDKRSWSERRLWFYFKVLQHAKIKKADKDAEERMKIEAEQMPKVYRDRPGIR
jgi:hypothetical protein